MGEFGDFEEIKEEEVRIIESITRTIDVFEEGISVEEIRAGKEKIEEVERPEPVTAVGKKFEKE